MTGLIHVYTGTGKGKTTAALGLSLRAMGRGYSVHFIQFMKGNEDYGEVRMARELPYMNLRQFGRDDFVDREDPSQEDMDLAERGVTYAREVMGSLPENGAKTLMVLDEFNTAVDFGLIKHDSAVDLITSKPGDLELVLTGRGASAEIRELADYVIEMVERKHPYRMGIMARKGVEF